MSHESTHSRLEKSALKAAQKAMKREGGRLPSAEEFGRMRIQTASPWARLAVAGLAGLFGLIALALWRKEIGWLAVIFAVGSLTAVIIAIVGRKKRVEDALAVIHLLSILEGLIDL